MRYRPQNPLTRKIRSWYYAHVDRYAYNIYSSKTECPERPLSEKVRIAIKEAGGYLSRYKLVERHIDKHLMTRTKEDGVLYYMSNPNAEHGLFMIDIDAHDGEQDALDVAVWLTDNYFPKAYYEPSTSRGGQHLYFTVCIGEHGDPRRLYPHIVNHRINLLANAVRYLVAEEGFEAKICNIYGTYSSGGIEGRIGKLPRPESEEQVQWLKTMEAQPWRRLADIIDLAESKIASASPLLELTPDSAAPITGTAADICDTNTISIMGSGDLRRGNGIQRKYYVVGLFQREHNRPATIGDLDAIYDLYVFLGLKGTSLARISKRKIKQIIPMFAASFRPIEHQFDPKKYLSICEQVVPVSAFDWKYATNNKLNHERLAAFVSSKVADVFASKTSHAHMARETRDATLKKFRTLKANGVINFTLNGAMYCELLKIAVKYGLLSKERDYEQPFRNSKGQRIDMGDGRKSKGRARLIGPGPILIDERKAFEPILKQVEAHEQKHAQRSA